MEDASLDLLIRQNLLSAIRTFKATPIGRQSIELNQATIQVQTHQLHHQSNHIYKTWRISHQYTRYQTCGISTITYVQVFPIPSAPFPLALAYSSLGDLFESGIPPEFQNKITRYLGKDISLQKRMKGGSEEVTTADVPLVHVVAEVMLMKVPDFVRHSLLEWGMSK